MKILYAGSPLYAVEPLKALVEGGKQVIAVLTRPDKPQGRRHILTPTPVKQYALEKGIPVLEFAKVREHVQELKALGADLMITCAYGQILSKETLAAFGLGVYNLHASLLPKFRGASPIQSAILAGEEYTGVTVMKTEPELDSGGILLVKRIKIREMTCGELSQKLSALSAEAAVEAVGLLEAGEDQLLMQDEAKATFCTKITKEDCKIDFTKPAEEVVRLIKAFSPEPAAYCRLNGNILNVLDASLADGEGRPGLVTGADKRGVVVACGNKAVNFLLLQPAGAKVMPARDFVNGRKIKAGDILD